MTVHPASISELAATVVPVLNQMDPDQVNRLVEEADWALPDPKDLAPAEFRAVRDEIERRVRELLAAVRAEQGGPSAVGAA